MAGLGYMLRVLSDHVDSLCIFGQVSQQISSGGDISKLWLLIGRLIVLLLTGFHAGDA